MVLFILNGLQNHQLLSVIIVISRSLLTSTAEVFRFHCLVTRTHESIHYKKQAPAALCSARVLSASEISNCFWIGITVLPARVHSWILRWWHIVNWRIFDWFRFRRGQGLFSLFYQLPYSVSCFIKLSPKFFQLFI